MQILELPALAGILEEAAGLAPLARGCALGVAGSHIPAGDFPHCLLLRHTRGGRAVPRGRSGVPSCDTGRAKEQVGQEQLKTLRATGRGERR